LFVLVPRPGPLLVVCFSHCRLFDSRLHLPLPAVPHWLLVMHVVGCRSCTRYYLRLLIATGLYPTYIPHFAIILVRFAHFTHFVTQNTLLRLPVRLVCWNSFRLVRLRAMTVRLRCVRVSYTVTVAGFPRLVWMVCAFDFCVSRQRFLSRFVYGVFVCVHAWFVWFTLTRTSVSLHFLSLLAFVFGLPFWLCVLFGLVLAFHFTAFFPFPLHRTLFVTRLPPRLSPTGYITRLVGFYHVCFKTRLLLRLFIA